MMSKFIFIQNRNFVSQKLKTKVGLLGVPYKDGTSRQDVGTELAPKLIREAGLIKQIQDFNENVDLKDFGDLPIDKTNDLPKKSSNNLLNYDGFMPLMKRLSEKIQEIRAENRICVTLGGDHSLAVGKITQINN